MKMTIIGGGGVRSIFLAKSVAKKAKMLKLTEVVFMDIDETKLKIFGGMAKKVCELIDNDLIVTLTTDKIVALKNAQYVITTIREGGDEMRVHDERIALDLGVWGKRRRARLGSALQ